MSPIEHEPKKVKRSFSLPSDLLEKVQEVSKSQYGGNASALVSEAVEAYIGSFKKRLPANDANCLVDLTSAYIPVFADEMRTECKDIDQPKALALLLMNFAGGKSGVSKKFLQAAEQMTKD